MCVVVLLQICRPSPAWEADDAKTALLQTVTGSLMRDVGALPNVLLSDWTTIDALYGPSIGPYYDADTDRVGHLPYTETYYAALATFVVRAVFSRHHRNNFKVPGRC